jgi:hypothetical protein
MKTIKECIINEYRGISGDVTPHYKDFKNGDEFIVEMFAILDGVKFFDAAKKAIDKKILNLKELSTDEFKENLWNCIFSHIADK